MSTGQNAKATTCALAVLLAVSAGCGSAAPSPPVFPATPMPSPTISHPSPTPVAATPEPTPSVEPSAPGLPTPTPPLADLSLDIQEIATEYTPHVKELRSLGNEILWVTPLVRGANSGPDIFYRYAPGDDEPEIVYRGERKDRIIGYVAGSSAGYAFSDYKLSPTLTGKWRVWYVAEPGAEPIMLDEGDLEYNNNWGPPLTMNDTYIAWRGLRGAGPDRVTELKAVRIDALDQVMTIASQLIDDGFVDWPALHDSELWYTAATSDWSRGRTFPRLEMRDLANLDAAPVIVAESIRGTMAAPSDVVVALKSGGVDEDAAINSGALAEFWRVTGDIEQLPIPGDRSPTGAARYPTVGNRFVAWEDETSTRFYLYDLLEHRFWRIAEYDWRMTDDGLVTPEGFVTRQSVADNLLAFVYYDPDEHPHLRWALLPE